MSTKKVVKKRTKATEDSEDESVVTKDSTFESVVKEVTEDHDMKDVETKPEPKPKTSKTPTEPALLQVFYSNSHDWNDVCMPHTIVVAQGKQEAIDLLQQQLVESIGHAEKQPAIQGLPLSQPGVCIFSIGLGELEGYDHKFETRPFVKGQKSEERDQKKWKLFFCNSHYTSTSTPAATIVIAKDRNEAGLFLMQTLQEMGVKEFGDMMLYPIDLATPSVYFLCQPSTATQIGDYNDVSFGAQRSSYDIY